MKLVPVLLNRGKRDMPPLASYSFSLSSSPSKKVGMELYMQCNQPLCPVHKRAR